MTTDDDSYDWEWGCWTYVAEKPNTWTLGMTGNELTLVLRRVSHLDYVWTLYPSHEAADLAAVALNSEGGFFDTTKVRYALLLAQQAAADAITRMGERMRRARLGVQGDPYPEAFS